MAHHAAFALRSSSSYFASHSRQCEKLVCRPWHTAPGGSRCLQRTVRNCMLGFSAQLRLLSCRLLSCRSPVRSKFKLIKVYLDACKMIAEAQKPQIVQGQPLTCTQAAQGPSACWLLQGNMSAEELAGGLSGGPRKSWLMRKRQEKAAMKEGLAEWQANPYFCAGRVTVRCMQALELAPRVCTEQ